MLVIWLFYKVYLVNVKSAFTRSIVSDRYKELDVSDESVRLDTKKSLEEDFEGGEQRPVSKEVGMAEVERRRQQHDSIATDRPLVERQPSYS